MGLPLEGIRILDFTRMMAGPFCSQMLGDMGAEVIKVELPELTEEKYGPHGLYGIEDGETTFRSSMYIGLNRSKKSLTLDLKHPKGKQIIYQLIDRSDVVMSNFRPGVMERLGFGYEQCEARNPRIIYVYQTGYGADGPYAFKAGQDLLAQGFGGSMRLLRYEDGWPIPVGTSLADLVSALYAAHGIMVALFVRERTGVGQRIDVNLLDSILAAQPQEATHFLNSGEMPTKMPRGGAMSQLSEPYGVYQTKDDFIIVSAARPGALPKLCKAMGIANLEEDERFDSIEKRLRSRQQLRDEVQKVLLQRTSAEWLSILEAADVWCAPVYSYEQTFSNPQVLHNQMVVSVEGPNGPLRLLGLPTKLSKTPGQVRLAPPTLGQHTGEILAWLGYTEEEMSDLRQEGVI